MMEYSAGAYEHKGAALVEVYQNWQRFQRRAFGDHHRQGQPGIDARPLEHGKPVRFGPDGEKGVIIAENGSAVIVDVAEVGEERILVHDESRPDPSLLLPFPPRHGLFTDRHRVFEGRRPP